MKPLDEIVKENKEADKKERTCYLCGSLNFAPDNICDACRLIQRFNNIVKVLEHTNMTKENYIKIIDFLGRL